MATRGVSKSKPIPHAGQIWFLEEPRLGLADHGHYVLITQVRNQSDQVNINFIATDTSFYDDFRIEQDRDEFPDSGLKHTCHLLRNHAYDLSIAKLLSGGAYKGFLTGNLKLEVERWWGETL